MAVDIGVDGFAASIGWPSPLASSPTIRISSGKTLTVGGAIDLNGTATYPVSFRGTGTLSPPTTIYYCSSSTVTGVDCQPGGPPPPVQASVESDLAFALTFLGIALFAAFKMRRDRKT